MPEKTNSLHNLLCACYSPKKSSKKGRQKLQTRTVEVVQENEDEDDFGYSKVYKNSDSYVREVGFGAVFEIF